MNFILNILINVLYVSKTALWPQHGEWVAGGTIAENTHTVLREMGEGKGTVGLTVIIYVPFRTKNTTGGVAHKHKRQEHE